MHKWCFDYSDGIDSCNSFWPTISHAFFFIPLSCFSLYFFLRIYRRTVPLGLFCSILICTYFSSLVERCVTWKFIKMHFPAAWLTDGFNYSQFRCHTERTGTRTHTDLFASNNKKKTRTNSFPIILCGTILVAIIFQLLNGIEKVLAWFQTNRMNGRQSILKPLSSVVQRFQFLDFAYMVNFQSKTVFWREKLNSIHSFFSYFFPFSMTCGHTPGIRVVIFERS